MSTLYHSEQSSSIPTTGGIYLITCVTTGKIYVGSALRLSKRRREHFSTLRRNKHSNHKLQHAFQKHGEDAFTFEVLELVLVPEMLTAREQYWFDKLKPFDKRGFNIDTVAGSRLGSTVSDETREKLRLANLGKKKSEEQKRDAAKVWLNRKHRPESIEKLRRSKMGHGVSDEARQNMRASQLGKKQSEETIEKRRTKAMGHSTSEETKAKIRASNAAHPTHIKRMKTLIVTDPNGVEYTITGIGQFAKEHNLNRSAISQVAMGKAPHHKGWTARYPDTDN